MRGERAGRGRQSARRSCPFQTGLRHVPTQNSKLEQLANITIENIDFISACNY